MGMSNETLQMIQSGGQAAGGVASLAALGNRPAPGAMPSPMPGGSPVPAALVNNYPTAPLKLAGSASAQPSPLPLVQPKSLMDILSSLSNGR
jgi:hypothetical protein